MSECQVLRRIGTLTENGKLGRWETAFLAKRCSLNKKCDFVSKRQKRGAISKQDNSGNKGLSSGSM